MRKDSGAGTQKVTIQDIADLAGVSKSTVSRYLNRGYISEAKAARIRAVIEQTGYQANFFAKRLKMKRSKLIGIVLPRMDSVSVGKLLSGIGRILEPAGYQGILLVSQLQEEKELENIVKFSQQGVDGIIVDSVGITPRHVALTRQLDMPLVYTGQQREGLRCLKIDDYAAGRLMGAYLRQMGHVRAVFLGVSEKDRAVGIDRKQGFIDAFTEGRPEARVTFMETGFDFFSAYNRGPELLTVGATVIVGATDNISLGVLRYFHERGIRVPDDISVAGFGGYDVGAVVYPALTSVYFDYELVGMKTAQYMLDAITGATSHLGGLPLHFLERESVRRVGVQASVGSVSCTTLV